MENDLINPPSSSLAALFLSGVSSDHDPFESALSSMASSPTATASNGGGFISGDGMMMRELIGRLGRICDSGEISPQSCIATANNTPLNSPPKFNLSSFPDIRTCSNLPKHPPSLAFFNGDPGFAERAAKFSTLSRVNSHSQFEGISGVFDRNFGAEIAEMGDSREVSSVSEQNPGGEFGGKSQNHANSRKRKSISKPKAVDDKAEAGFKNERLTNGKKSKTEEEEAKKENAEESKNNSKDNNNNSNSNNSNIKETAKPEPPKDYIHVRARRGQATDSHSLAERVRREKISERMKFLQDLVPGCNKVTGKATVLDEIINYVQSLQRQVEFLSMKLATVNPRMDFNMEALLSKDMFQCRGSTLPQTMYPLEQSSAQALPFGFQPSQQMPTTLLNGFPNGSEPEPPFSVNPLNDHPNSALQLPWIAGLTDPMTQLPPFWENDLLSIVQMGTSQNQNQAQIGSSTLSNAQMKVEK